MTAEYGRQELRSPRLWLTAFVSLLLSFGAGALWSTHAWPLPYGARTHGTVIDVQVWHLPLHPAYLPTVDYWVDGAPYRVAAALPSFIPIAPGESLAIEYPASRPAHGKIGYELDIFVIWLTAAVVFAIDVSIAGFLRRKGVRTPESRDSFPKRYSLKIK